MTHDEYLALRARFSAQRRTVPAPASNNRTAACAACGRALCAHPDPVYAGIIPLHGPSGSHRAAGIETANAAGARPNPMPTLHDLHQPTAGAAGMVGHRKDQSTCGSGPRLTVENGRQSSTPVSMPGAAAAGLCETHLFALERNPATGRPRASLWA